MKWRVALLCLIIGLYPLKATAVPVPAIGAAVGVVVANWNRDLSRDTLILDTVIGAGIGAGLGLGGGKALGSGFWDALAIGRDSLPILAAGGTLFGAGNAIRHQAPIVEGIWSGFTGGLATPGIVIGTGAGIIAGSIYDLSRNRGLTEDTLVGYGTLGAGLLGTGAMGLGAGDIGGNIGQGASAIGAGIMAFHMGRVVVVTAIKARQSHPVHRKLPPPVPDHIAHNHISRQIRDEFGVGPALILGYAKESQDFFLRSGHPEFRDLQNNWNGVFRMGRPYF